MESKIEGTVSVFFLRLEDHENLYQKQVSYLAFCLGPLIKKTTSSVYNVFVVLPASSRGKGGTIIGKNVNDFPICHYSLVVVSLPWSWLLLALA